MAAKKEMNMMNLEETSIIFPYNRIYDLSRGTKFFDDIWQNKEAFVSRYPAFLLNGKVTEKKGKINVKEAKIIIEENWKDMVAWCKNTLHYIKNVKVEMHDYTQKQINFKYSRQHTNFEGVLDCINAYSQSQIEYDGWIEWVNQRISDYEAMASIEHIKIVEERVE